MSRDCFQDEQVAGELNAAFVNIKVDREERPDVDALYMQALQIMTKHGGWPMTIFMDTDGRPFFGGTYFPKNTFLRLIDDVVDLWDDRRDDVHKQSAAVTSHLAKHAAITPNPGPAPVELLNATLEVLGKAFDAENGGFGAEPKFPSCFHIELILRAYLTNPEEGPREVLATTLNGMASGGMYDHIGGGFARYSVDAKWLVPHFEKMLYDQANLISTYRRVYGVLGQPQFLQVVVETIEYVLRELRLPSGGFASAQDADSLNPDGDSVEGWYYTWTPDEVREALHDFKPEYVDETLEWFGITDEGNFAGRSIPNRLHQRGDLRRPEHIDAARDRLFAARAERPLPARDDKVITEWNAMFLATLCEAAMTLRQPHWRQAAIDNAEFLVDNLRDAQGRWFRTWHADGDPKARHLALAGDYAYLVEAFIKMSEMTGESRWMTYACETADAMLDNFWDPTDGGLFTTPEDGDKLIVRQKPMHDDALGSANSVALSGLIKLAALTGEDRYLNHADRIYQLFSAVLQENPVAASNALLATEVKVRGMSTLVLPGVDRHLVGVAQVLWRPDLVLAWGDTYDSPIWQGREEGNAYMCKGQSCEAPVSTAEELYRLVTGRELAEGQTLEKMVLPEA